MGVVNVPNVDAILAFLKSANYKFADFKKARIRKPSVDNLALCQLHIFGHGETLPHLLLPGVSIGSKQRLKHGAAAITLHVNAILFANIMFSL